MSDGQLAMNTNLVSPGLFLKDSNGDLVKVGPVHVGTTAPNATPGAGGQAGNSKGEQWLDTSSSRYVFKIWDGTDWRTEDGEFVNSSGDTMTGALAMDNQQQVRFREATANGTNYIALQAPASVASDKTITLPDVTGTVVTTGDTGSVTSTMLLDGTILNADINASAAIVDTKLATISTAGKVSGTAITSGNIVTSGSFNTTGSILVDSSSPTIRLEESDGTATHNRTLLIRDGNAFSIRTRSSADASVSTDYIIDTNASGAESHSWRIANTEKARIDSSGRLLVGTSTALTTFFGTAVDKVAIAGGAAPQVIGCYVNNQFGARVDFVKSRSGTVNGQTVVQVNDTLGEIYFGGSDGTAPIPAARVYAEVDGTPGANDMPGRLVMSVTLDGASSPTEAMRITNDRVIAYNQPTPTSKSAAATLTITELKTGIIQYTGAVATLTLPTGTLMEGGFSGIYTNMAFEWSVINTGTGICTIGAGTAHTIVGSATVAIGASARFVSRRTASNTFVSYCLS